MSPRNLLNLSLLAAFVGLLLLAIYQPGIDPAPVAARLTTLDTDNIVRQRLERPGQASIELLRHQPGQWQMLQPYNAAANEFVAGNLRELVETSASADYAVAEIQLTAVGLDPPAASLLLDSEAPATTTQLDFGDTDPVHGNRYVRNGERVYLIPEHLSLSVLGSAADRLSTALLPPDFAIQRIELPAYADQTALVLQRDDGGWSIEPTPPEPLSPAQADALNAYVNRWTHAQAQAVQAFEPAASPPSGPPADRAAGLTTPPKLPRIGLASADEVLHFELHSDPAGKFALVRSELGLAWLVSGEQLLGLLRPAALNTAARPGETGQR